jgi:hypothetical protein
VGLKAPYGLLPDNLYYPRWPVVVRRLGAPEPVRASDLVPFEAAPRPRIKPELATDRPTLFEHVHEASIANGCIFAEDVVDDCHLDVVEY